MLHKKRSGIMGLICLFLLAGTACEDQSLEPADTNTNALVTEEGSFSDAREQPFNFRTHLSGENEVPAVETRAQGQATFRISKDGESVSYKLIVANIENVRMAHIHLAPEGENGGVVVWLYPSSPPPQLIEGRFQGVLAEGSITEDDLVGDLENATLEELLEEIRSGNTYVNVHTSQHPGGEIRGQIR